MLLANRSDASEVFENSHITGPLLEFDWLQLIRSSAKACVAPKVIAVARTILEKAFIHPPKGKRFGSLGVLVPVVSGAEGQLSPVSALVLKRPDCLARRNDAIANVILCVCSFSAIFFGLLARGCYLHLSFNQPSIALNTVKCDGDLRPLPRGCPTLSEMLFKHNL